MKIGEHDCQWCRGYAAQKAWLKGKTTAEGAAGADRTGRHPD